MQSYQQILTKFDKEKQKFKIPYNSTQNLKKHLSRFLLTLHTYENRNCITHKVQLPPCLHSIHVNSFLKMLIFRYHKTENESMVTAPQSNLKLNGLTESILEIKNFDFQPPPSVAEFPKLTTTTANRSLKFTCSLFKQSTYRVTYSLQ